MRGLSLLCDDLLALNEMLSSPPMTVHLCLRQQMNIDFKHNYRLPREGNVGSVDSVGAIRIEILSTVHVGAVDVDILQEDFARMYERHGPHLRLQEVDALDDGVGEASESDLMRPAWIIADTSEPVVPDLPVAVESADTAAMNMDLVAAEDEGGGLILISHRHGVFKPVRDVVAPKERTFDVHFHVGEARDLHHGFNVV